MKHGKTTIDAYEAGLSFATAYRELYNLYYRAKETGEPEGLILLAPVISNGCLAVELYLKFLLVDYIDTHHISNLLGSLIKTKKLVCDQLMRTTIGVMKRKGYDYYSPDHYENDLIQFDNAFAEWRYFFEFNPNAQGKMYNLDFLDAFLVSLEGVCALERSFTN